MTTRADGTDAEVLAALVAFVAAWSSPDAQGRIAAQVGVTIPEADIRALYSLGRSGGGVRPMALAADVHVTRPTTSKTIARLRDAGLVQRSASAGDARGALVQLTPAGHDAYQRLVDAGVGMVRAAFTGVADDSAHEFARLVTRVVDELPNNVRGNTPPADFPRKSPRD
ncbi:MAG: MarR family winged helix-turn-helix transcriptional regulator [Microbacteriaceae bacterium]